MLAIRLFALLLATCLPAFAAPSADDSIIVKPLKQTTRNEVVMRASRTRARRATISGSTIPNSVNHQTFVVQASSSDASLNGRYARAYDATAPTQANAWLYFSTSTPVEAALYYLDDNSYLVRREPQGAGQYQYAAVTGSGYSNIVFDTANDAISATSGNRIFVRCEVSSSSILSCRRANAPDAQLELQFCGGSIKVLALVPPGTGCTSGDVIARAAIP